MPTDSPRAHARRLVKARAGILLDIGCAGRKNGIDWVGLDDHPAADIRRDYRLLPWPVPTDAARVIALSHVVEYVPPAQLYALMREVHRVGRHGGEVYIVAPYGTAYHALADPEVVAYTNEATWGYFDNRAPNWEKRKPPVFHLLEWRRVPLPGSVDYNVKLAICKDSSRCDLCPKPAAASVPPAASPSTKTKASAKRRS